MMQHPIVRSVFAILLAIAVAAGLFMLIEGIGSVLHPWPENFGGTFEEVAEQVKNYPAWVLVLLGGVGYGITMFLCTFIATRLGHNRHAWHGYGIGLFLFAMVVINLSMLPYPGWYWALMFIVLPAAAYFGTGKGSIKST